MNTDAVDDIWQTLRAEAAEAAQQDAALASFYHASILNHASLAGALAFTLATSIDSDEVQAVTLHGIIENVVAEADDITRAAAFDMVAYKERDPACDQFILPFLYFKGFQAIQLHRVAHELYGQGRKVLALFLQSRSASALAVDIHPAAEIGHGIMVDHGTGLVVGETAKIGENVSILHQVSLGGSGQNKSRRHPAVAHDVLLAAGATLLGSITVGEGAKIAAGSVVLESVPALSTVAGVPARVVGRHSSAAPAREMNQGLD